MGKRVIVTSGGTFVNIDEVRVLTNISKGNLSAKIAEALLWEEYVDEILYVHSKTSVLPNVDKEDENRITYIEANTPTEVYNVLEKNVPNADAIVHAMAISDFEFEPVNEKLKSNDMEGFLESLKSRCKKAPKIISKIKEWNPYILLFGFKFESGKTRFELIDIAKAAMRKDKSDYVFANDKMMMNQAKSHCGFLISDKHRNVDFNEFGYCELRTRKEIARKIAKIIVE